MINRKYGIEIEAIYPRGETGVSIAAAIAAGGVPCHFAGYTHARSTDWKVVTDGSLSGGNGYEVVSPPMVGEAGLEQINKVCAVLAQLQATVNRTCGLHVHVDAGSLSAAALRRLAVIYIENENIIDSLMPASRRAASNRWCNTLRNTNMARLAIARNANDVAHAIAHGDRYVKLNYTAFLRHGTVEFRHHSGTVDAAKINMWLQACLKMVACAVKEADLPIDTSTAAPVHARPRNRRLATIFDAMQRPGGCTREDIRVLLNRSTLPPMNRILRGAGFQYRVTHAYGDRRTERYVLAETPVPTAVANVSATPITFDGFCDRIELAQTEKDFWIARRVAVNNPAVSHVA
jgi:Putative amidoligase enzyme